MRERPGPHGLALEVRVSAGGKRLTRTVRAAGTTAKAEAEARREAQRVLTRLLAEIDEGRHSGQGGTVGDLLRQWEDTVGPRWSPSTSAAYGSYIRHHIVPHLGATPVSKLRPHHLDHLYAELVVGGMAAGSVAKVHTILRSALTQGVRWGWIARSPATDATPPKVPRGKLAPPTTGQLRQLLALADDARDPDFGTYLRLAADTGARRGELVALRWVDVDLDAGEVLLERAAVTGPDGQVTIKGTKTDRERRVALAPGTVASLRAHRARWEARVTAAGDGATVPQWVFASQVREGEAWRPTTVTQHFSRLRAKAGLPHVRGHDLRHYVATTLLGAGVDQRTVMGRLGHSSLASLTRYSHFLAPQDRAAANALGQLLEG